MGERPWEGFAKAETMSKAGRKKKKMEGKAMNTIGRDAFCNDNGCALDKVVCTIIYKERNMASLVLSWHYSLIAGCKAERKSQLARI